MFRGRGGQNNSSRPGNNQVNRGPNQNKQFGGTKDASPKTQAKVAQVTPAKGPSNAPGKTPTSKPDQRNGPRPRSRSPIDRKGETSNNDDAQPSTEEKMEEQQPFKYTGRPGEKKFNGRCKLFVANLNSTMTEDDLKELFGEFGETGELFVNKEKGFGFIRMDYRHNAEIAKISLDKKLVKNRNIHVHYATHASAVELHGLDNFASNDFIERAMSSFGTVERCVVVCDDRGRSKGYAIVEFEWKRSAVKVLDRLKDEMFVLGRLPKPVFAKPFIRTDEEEGVKEEALERLEGLEAERSHEPRFISPNSFEYVWAKRWRDLFIEEQDKKAKLEQEMTDARCKLEFEMEAAIRQEKASKIREELARRQDELRMLEEDMMRRQEADMRILERSRQRELAARQGQPEPSPRSEQELRNNEIQLSRENAVRQQDFLNLRQRAEMTMQNEPFQNDGRGQSSGGGMRSEMMGQGGLGQQRGGPQQQGYPSGYGQQGGPRSQHQGMDYRSQQQGGPPREMQQREMQQRQMQQREMQQRQMQQRGMEGRGMPPRDIPPAQDSPARELAREAQPSKDKPAEEKTTEPAAAKAAAVVDPSKGPRR